MMYHFFFSFIFPLGICRGKPDPTGVKDKIFTPKEAPARQKKVWIFTDNPCKSLGGHSFQNKRILALFEMRP